MYGKLSTIIAINIPVLLVNSIYQIHRTAMQFCDFRKMQQAGWRRGRARGDSPIWNMLARVRRVSPGGKFLAPIGTTDVFELDASD